MFHLQSRQQNAVSQIPSADWECKVHGLLPACLSVCLPACLPACVRTCFILPKVPEIVQAVDAWISRMRSSFGVMTERGDGLFGFIHLTFEEYFAGATIAWCLAAQPPSMQGAICCATTVAMLSVGIIF